MFIHIGGDVVVRTKEVIAIIDLNHVDYHNKKAYAFMNEAEKSKEVIRLSNDDVKSFVITTDKVYYSPISSLTLKKRANIF